MFTFIGWWIFCPRLDILRQSKVDFDKIDGFLVNSIAQPFQRETFLLWAFHHPRLLRAIATLTSKLNNSLYHLFRIYRLAATARFEISPTDFETNSSPISPYPERIYISRAKSQYRRLLMNKK
jgi:hypothetical protein